MTASYLPTVKRRVEEKILEVLGADLAIPSIGISEIKKEIQGDKDSAYLVVFSDGSQLLVRVVVRENPTKAD